MAVKTNQALKKQRKLEKKAKVDKITNWFMINLAWGIFGFIILRYMHNPLMTDWDDFVTGDKGPVKTTLTVLAVIVGIVAVALIVLRFVMNKKDIKFFKNKSRVLNYGIFLAVVALVLAYLGSWNLVRLFMVDMLPFLGKLDTSFWISGGLSYAIGIYLAVAFIYTAVRVAIIEKKK